MKKTSAFFFLALTIFLILLMPLGVGAQGLKNINGNLDLTSQSAGVKSDIDLISFAALIVQGLLGLLGMIFVILIIYGGFQWMTAAGSEEKVTKAKKIIINSVIGLIIIMLSYSIAYLAAIILTGGA